MRTIEYGRSMYGGWYCTFAENGMIDGIQAKSYKDLLAICKERGVKLESTKKKDH